MRRKKDDKRVLRAGNGQQKNSKRIRRGNNTRKFSKPKGLSFKPKGPSVNRAPRRKRKANKSLVLIMIIALIAFVIGAGIGISLCLDEGSSDEGPHYKNVTQEMTSNLNHTDDVYTYDYDVDSIDYNENSTTLKDMGYENITYENEN